MGIDRSMRRVLTLLLAILLLTVYSAQIVAPANALSGEIRLAVVSDAVGIPAAASEVASQSSLVVNVTFSLAFSNQAGLNNLLVSLYTPGNPMYHHWLSPDQFYARFGPSPASVSAVEDYLNGFGAITTSVSGHGTLITFSASEVQLQKALGVTFYSFIVDGSPYYSSKGIATLPLSIAPLVVGIEGLQDYSQFMHPAVSAVNYSAATPSYVPPTYPTASPPYNPATIKLAYNFTGLYSRGLYGNGVSVSIVTAFSYDNSTIQTFDSMFGIAPLNMKQIQPYGTPSTNGLETTLDAEWMSTVVPNATINVVEGPNAQLSTFTNLFDYVISHNLSSVMSTSWGTPESGASGSGTPPSVITSDNNIFKQAAVQGIEVTTASGDFGAYDNTSQLTPDFPSSSPYVTSVGGTWLNMSQSGKTISRGTETVWNMSGGGVSNVFSTPSYQSNLPGPLVLKGRGVPDVSFSARPSVGYFVYFNGSWLGAGGTSFGAPIWAGIFGLENQLRNSAGESNLGFANPAIYPMTLTSNYSNIFYDITQGNNGYYSAGPGYDLASGLGTPNVNNLALLLAKIPTSPLAVTATATPSWGDSPLITSLYANISGGFAPYSVEWYLNNTLNGSGSNLLVSLKGAAIYHFKAVVTDNASVTAESFVNVTVYPQSTTNSMSLSATPNSGDANLAVTLSASLSNPPPLLTSSFYLWAFGDTSASGNTSSTSTSHVYRQGGNFTVLVTAFISSSGSPRGYYTSQATAQVRVAPPLKAVIVSNRTGGSYPLQLKLQASSSGGTPSFSYSWTYFNETGSHSSTQGTIYVNYSTAGSYLVSLNVTDSFSKTAQTTMTVTVYNPMNVTIFSSPSTSGVAPFNVTFHASVSGGAGGYYYEWDFGNGSTTRGNPVTHVFENGGKQTVTLTVTDLAGDTVHGNVTVSIQSLGLLNLLKGETALVILALAIIIAAVISYALSRRRRL